MREIFEASTDKYTFEDVSDLPQYYHKGDIKATCLEDGREIFIEVKDDSRIHQTKNILCEDEVYYKDADYWAPGNMESDYDIYVIVS